MPKIERLPIIIDPDELREAVRQLPEYPDRPIVARVPSLEDYVTAVFGEEVASHSLMATHVDRPPNGIGPHWDVHNDLLDPNFPFVATFNRRGRATVRTAILDEELSRDYDKNFPDPTNEARRVRRHYGAIAFATAEVVGMAEIGPGYGLVFPQLPGTDAPKIVHSIEPLYPSHPGDFIKFAVPNNTIEARDEHVQEGFAPYTTLVKPRFFEELPGVGKETPSNEDDSSSSWPDEPEVNPDTWKKTRFD